MVGKNVTYSHNVVVSFTAQNQQALLQATQGADRALQSYNRTIQTNVTQLSNVTRAQQSYQSSLTQASTQTTNMGRNVATMNSQFSATVNPIKNSGNALNQFNATTIQSGTSLSKFGGFMKNNLTNVALLAGGIAGLDDQFHRMTKAQVGAERANLILDKAEQKVVKTEQALAEMRAKGLENTNDYAIKLKDLEINQEAVTIAQDRASVAQTTLSEATEDFWVGILPNALFIGGSVASMISSLGLNMSKLKGFGSSAATAIAGLGGAFGGLKQSLTGINFAGLASAFTGIIAPVAAVAAGIWFLLGSIKAFNNVNALFTKGMSEAQKNVNVARGGFLQLKDVFTDLTKEEQIELDAYNKNMQITAETAKVTSADIQKAWMEGYLNPLPEGAFDAIVNGITGMMNKVQGAFQTGAGEIADDPAMENALQESIIIPYDKVAEQAKIPSQAIGDLIGHVMTTQVKEGVLDSTELLNEMGIVIEDNKTKTDEWDKKIAEAAIQGAQYANTLALILQPQKIFNAGLVTGTENAGKWIAEIMAGKTEAEGFHNEMVRLSGLNNDLATDFLALQNQYHLTNEEAKGFFETQQEGGDTIKFLADAIKDEAAPALEYYNKLLESGSKKEFGENWEDYEKQLEKMGLDDDTIDLIERNAERKDEVFKAIRNMGRGVESIQLIGIEEVETAGKTFDKITDNIIENYDRIVDRDDDLKSVKGFPEYVERVVASGDPEQLKNLSNVIDLINLFWENDKDIDPHEAALIDDAINGIGTASGDAAPKVKELTEEQQKIADNTKIAEVLIIQAQAFQSQLTFVDLLNKSLALRNSLLGMNTEKTVPFVTDVSGTDYGSSPYGGDMCVDEYGRRVSCASGKPTKKQPLPSAIERKFNEKRYMENPETFAVAPYGYQGISYGGGGNVPISGMRGIKDPYTGQFIGSYGGKGLQTSNIITQMKSQMAGADMFKPMIDAAASASKGIQTVFSSMFTAVNGIFDGIAQHWSNIGIGMIATSESVSKVGVTHFNKLAENSAGLLTMLAGHWSNQGANMIETGKSISVASNKTFKQLVNNAAGNFTDLAEHWSNEGANMIETAKSVAKGINKELDNIEDEEVRINIVTTKTTKYEVKNIQHGGAFIRNAQHGMAGIIGRPISMDGMLMGEHSKPELVTVTPLTNPNNIADTSIKLSATGANNSGSNHLLQRILAAIESIRLDASFKLEGNDIVRSKDIFASISPLLGKQLAQHG